VDGVPPLSFLMDWDIVQGGVYFFPRNDILTLNYFDFSTRKARPIFKISGGGAFPGLSVSPDGVIFSILSSTIIAATSCSSRTSTKRIRRSTVNHDPLIPGERALACCNSRMVGNPSLIPLRKSCPSFGKWERMSEAPKAVPYAAFDWGY